MNAHHFTYVLAATFGLAAFSTAGCGEKDKTVGAALPPAPDSATAPATAGSAPVIAAQAAPTAGFAVASVEWIEIKDCTYDMRDQFFAGLTRLEAKVDEQVRELTALRAAMTSTSDTEAWDFAMKEMNDARSYLKSVGAELRKATPETWDQQKEKVGQAWVRAHEAYNKVKSSTTGG